MPAMSMQAVLDVHPRDYGVSETGGVIVYIEPGEGKSIACGCRPAFPRKTSGR